MNRVDVQFWKEEPGESVWRFEVTSTDGKPLSCQEVLDGITDVLLLEGELDWTAPVVNRPYDG